MEEPKKKKKTTLRAKQDEAVKNFFQREVVTELDDHKTYAKKVDDWTKRFEAIRSIQGLSYGDNPDTHPKTDPWEGCSDLGVPIEAITIRAIIARFVKTIFTKPICNVGGRSSAQDVKDAKTVQEYNEYSLQDEMEFERHYYDVMMDVALAGDGYGKLIEANEDYEWEETYFTLINPETEEPYLDSKNINEYDENWPRGYPLEVDEDFDPPVDPAIDAKPRVEEITVEKTDKTFFGTKMIPVDPRDLIVPKGAEMWDIQELPWVGHRFRKAYSWLKRREGDPEEGGYENIDKLSPKSDGKDKEKEVVDKIELIELWGQVPIPTSATDPTQTKVREIIGLWSVEQGELHGWVYNPYRGKRMLFHWQIMPMPHRFRGKSIPEFAKGLRNLIDAIFNNLVNRDTINSHAPFVYDEESGFDPEIHSFGPQEFWGVSDKSRLGRLDMGNTTEFNSQWIIQFTMGLLQRLFGVTDYTLGTESTIASNQTARGIMALIGEGNFSFDTMISLLQMTNRRFFEANIRMHAKMMKEAKMEKKAFFVTESPDNPFREIQRNTLSLNWNFIPRGTSMEANLYKKREDATVAMKVLGQNIFFSPDLSPTTANNYKLLTQRFVDAYGLREVKLPDIKEIQQEMMQMKVAVQKQIMKEQQIEKLKAVAKNKKGTPEGDAAKKVLGDLEIQGELKRIEEGKKERESGKGKG